MAARRRDRQTKGGRLDRLARRLSQAGFLLLFLYPWLVTLYGQLVQQPAPTLASWLLSWDPLLKGGEVLHRDWGALVAGVPLILLGLILVVGRSFCGWVCPLGTSLDFIRWVFSWRRDKRRLSRIRFFNPAKNSPVRYFLLAFILGSAILSLKPLGLIDPLVVFQRLITALKSDFSALQQPPLRVYFSVISIIFFAFAVLEIWQPRFWCRNLCPLGTILGLASRLHLLNRRVGPQCSECAACRRACPMNAISQEPHRTDYSACTFCLECESVCPKARISFGFNPPFSRQSKGMQGESMLSVSQAEDNAPARRTGFGISRREALGGVIAGLAGLAIVPLSGPNRKHDLIRPPGALPEEQFLRTCILCQECVRACPTGGLRPAFLEGGLAAIGTPHLVPRQGGCALNPSCPDLCGQVCPTGALQATQPEQLKLGLARVDHSLCLAWDQGARCLVCVEACLVKAARVYQGRIVIDPQLCTGCGRCECGCPVAGSAIHVFPIET